MEASYFTMLWWFCHTLTWIRHGCTCVPHLTPPLPHPSPSHPSGLSQCTGFECPVSWGPSREKLSGPAQTLFLERKKRWLNDPWSHPSLKNVLLASDNFSGSKSTTELSFRKLSKKRLEPFTENIFKNMIVVLVTAKKKKRKKEKKTSSLLLYWCQIINKMILLYPLPVLHRFLSSLGWKCTIKVFSGVI